MMKIFLSLLLTLAGFVPLANAYTDLEKLDYEAAEAIPQAKGGEVVLTHQGCARVGTSEGTKIRVLAPVWYNGSSLRVMTQWKRNDDDTWKQVNIMPFITEGVAGSFVHPGRVTQRDLFTLIPTDDYEFAHYNLLTKDWVPGEEGVYRILVVVDGPGDKVVRSAALEFEVATQQRCAHDDPTPVKKPPKGGNN